MEIFADRSFTRDNLGDRSLYNRIWQIGGQRLVDAEGGSQWSAANVSPSDWLAILSVELQSASGDSTNKQLINWLNKFGVKVTSPDLSKIRQMEDCRERRSVKVQSVVDTIIANVAVASIVQFLEAAAYRAMKGFLPRGNPFRAHMSEIPEGAYQATRYSFSHPQKVMRSCFNFFTLPKGQEPIAGYGDVNTEADRPGQSSVLRYREIRHGVENGSVTFKVINSGFVFYELRSFVLVGCSLTIKAKADEENFSVTDVKRAKGNFITLYNGTNPSSIKGIEVTSFQDTGNPAAAVLLLNRVSSKPIFNSNDAKAASIQVGIFDEKSSPSIEKLLPNLDPDNQIGNGMLFVK